MQNGLYGTPLKTDNSMWFGARRPRRCLSIDPCGGHWPMACARAAPPRPAPVKAGPKPVVSVSRRH